ncbi:MAG: SufS family cysteine desulfurase [Thermoanaerobaculia bacterium]
MELAEIRKDFPILKRKINGHKLIYFDNAATTQKPVQVIKAIEKYYREKNANIHRGVHTLSQEATFLYEEAHKVVSSFINSKKWEEVIFVRNTTEALNLIAYTLGRGYLNEGDLVLTTKLDHHSNILPWLLLKEQKKIRVELVEITKEGILDLEDLENKLKKGPKVLALSHISNITGWISPLKEIVKKAHREGAVVVADGAQAAAHIPVDVQELDVDFYAFSGHKMLGPMGIGVLYGKENLLSKLPPFLSGGDMLETLSLSSKTCQLCLKTLPWKYEAGTSNVEGAIGLMEAIKYIKKTGFDLILKEEKKLLKFTLENLKEMKNVEIYGPEDLENRIAVIPFNLKGFSSNEVASVLDQYGIAIRSGYHCAQPFHEALNIPSSARVSFYIYNTTEEVKKFLKVLKKLI